MTVHIINEKLVVAELSKSESEESAEQLGGKIYETLDKFDIDRWSSVELELFRGKKTSMVFAVPVKVLLPECLLSLETLGELQGLYDLTGVL